MSGIAWRNDEPYERNFPAFGDSAPGDMFPSEADVTVYWPRVRACYDAAPTSTTSDVGGGLSAAEEEGKADE